MAPSLVDVIDRLADVHVLCIGDVMLDRFVYGTVGRISPEAPIPVLDTASQRSALGGVGNVAANLRALGVNTTLICALGVDPEGNEVEGLLEVLGVEAKLARDPERPTSLKVRYSAAGQQMLRVDRETTEPLASAVSTALLSLFDDALPRAEVVVVSDYAKGVLTAPVLRHIIDQCRAHKVPVVVDPKGGDYARYAGATALTPNTKELEALTGHQVSTDEEAASACGVLLGTSNFGAVLATRGARGMSLVNTDGCSHLRAQAKEVFDVSGAGDTVIAAFCAATGAGASLYDAARLANTAAGIVVEKMGTAVVTADELLAALRQQLISPRTRKQHTLDATIMLANQWRSQGLKVGFTNGCFDLVHPGHLSLLHQAANACDRLIVALNDDASVRRLKGPQRPVQDEHARAAVLASMEAVDAVITFGGDTPLAEITALAPDVLVKGADYTEDEVVGADVVKAAGGSIVLATLVDGVSTTGTISRIDKTRT
jgi:D-beta-D-heptose 7-phosphate kinase/D-beta-D-heptose 1-phosphate adenosyltransferase